MKRIINWFLNEDGHLDWLKHLILGSLIFAICLFGFSFITEDFYLNLTISNVVVVFAGFSKEMYDREFKQKDADGLDIFWTWLAPLLCSIVIIITQNT